MRARIALGLASLLVITGSDAALARKKKDDKKLKVFDFSGEAMSGSMAPPMPSMRSPGRMGATAGGAKDIAYFRDRVGAGEIPHANVFTPEGLFSEHDLPIKKAAGCTRLFCLVGEGSEARVMTEPQLRYLAQIGFASGLNTATFKRAPLNLIAVVDKSGSMSGQPIELVKQSLQKLAKQLNDDDQMAIVLYGDTAHVHLEPTSMKRRAEVESAISAITISGSTYMEAGLQVGYDLARKSKKSFRGMTRVMLFTDERPNVGDTSAKGFMGMAETASRQGIGLSTIGVGVQFGAELATKVAGVRGGNLFFFPDAQRMVQVFTEELDTLVTELAYDVDLVVTPGAGLKIAGVYGLPNDMLTWEPDGRTVKLHVATIFPSKRSGAIYVGLQDESAALPTAQIPVGTPVATVRLGFTPRAGKRESGQIDITRSQLSQASIGLRRGLLLVNQALALKQATTLHHQKNDQEGAYQIVHALAALFKQAADPDLAKELKLIEELEKTLAKLSGHQGEPQTPPPPAVVAK